LTEIAAKHKKKLPPAFVPEEDPPVGPGQYDPTDKITKK